MSKEATKDKKVRQPRAATFRVVKKLNRRYFIAVNKRAKRYAAVVGVSELSLKNLKAIKAFNVRILESPSLKKIV